MPTSKSQSEKGFDRIYVIAGKEESLVNAECDRVLDELIEPEQRAMGLFSFDAASVSGCDVLDEVRTAGLLTRRKVVLVKSADNFISRNRQLLEKYFAGPCGTGVLILTVNSWPANTKLARKLPSIGKLISVTQPRPWQLPQRLMRYSNDAHDKTLDRHAAELLVELVGDDLCRLYIEIDKLALFAHTEKAITVGHIESLIGHNRLFNTFAVIDACLTGETAKAVNRLRDMFSKDRSAEYAFIGAFAYHFRRLFGAKRLLEDGLAPSEITKKLRIWSNADRFFAQLRKISLAQIAENLKQLAEIDYAIKTGRAKPQVAAEQLVLQLSGSLESIS